jgi:hypothetical protein
MEKGRGADGVGGGLAMQGPARSPRCSMRRIANMLSRLALRLVTLRENWFFTQKFLGLGLSTQSWMYIGKIPNRDLKKKIILEGP